MTSSAAIIQARGLTRSFGDNIAVDGIALSVAKGEIYGLVGPDGAGKTTTLRMLAGILDPSRGDIQVAGCRLPEQRSALKEQLAYMSQRFGLYLDLTVEENVLFYSDLYGVARKGRDQVINRLLDFSSMRPFRKRLAANLSGGMKQKLQLVCALIHTPAVLLLDEPTNGVDPVSRRDFWRILYRLLKDGVTILVSTAYLDEAERCSRVGLMNQGRIIAEGPPEEIRRSMTRRILSIRSPKAREVSRVLTRAMEADCNVNVYGDRVHVICTDPQAAARAAGDLLQQAGVPADDFKEIEPGLEDIFVSTLGPAKTGEEVGFQRDQNNGAGDGKTGGGQWAVEVHGLTRRFGDFTAVDNISFEVPKGEIFGFLGPNGAGKSTTIRMLCGLLAPTAGKGRVAGCDILTQAEAIKGSIGYMSQKFSLYEDLSVGENISFYGGIYGLGGARLAQRKTWALAMAGLNGRESSPARLLAGGWKQRLALACAILHKPPIVFLDEPTSGVDPLSRRRFWDLIYDMAGQGVTVFVTTHYMEEAEYCDRVALIYRGRMIALGTPSQLKTGLVHESILDVRCARPQEIIDDLAVLPGVRDAALFGAGLHVKVDQTQETEARIRALLDRKQMKDVTVVPITPTMEDVFVSMIEKEDAKDP